MGGSDDVRDCDIAVVGMACRLPGADDVEEFWQNLRDGRESTTFFTDEALLAAGVSPAALQDPRYVKAGQVIGEAGMFDAAVFGVTAEEAEVTDPQQRHFLECALAALENAAHDPDRHPGAIGVYGGVGLNTYLLHHLSDRFRSGSTVERYRLMLGNDKDFLATRVAYRLNLRGPAVSVSTACSTSLVAVHLACVGLLGGECDLALAGGAHIRVPQTEGYLYQEGMILSPDGRCRAFDADAAGTVVGSGVGVVVLRRLADALEAGDHVHAVIRGTAINNDGGQKAGYTAPSVPGQAAVIGDALAVADCPADTISYVEAHGTATPLGDPVEIAALTAAFGPAGTTAKGRGRCAIGSVKTNIGHLDAASGIAGLIKTVLMLEHGWVVPSLHFQAPNPDIDLAGGPFRVATELAAWPGSPAAPRRAGVSSFGIGGTNAHAVLQQPPEREPAAPSVASQLLVISAATPEALDVATQNLARHLLAHRDELNLADVAYTLALGRREYACRRAALVHDVHDAALTLALDDPDRVTTGHVTATSGTGPAVFGAAGTPAGRAQADLPEAGCGADAAGPGRDAMLAAIARQWADGASVNWAALFTGRPHRRVPLPSYPYQRRRYWVEPDRPAAAGAGLPGSPTEDTLRTRVEAAVGPHKAAHVIEFIRTEVADMLDVGLELIGADTDLFTLGLDSLNLIEIAAKLSAEFDRDVPASLFDEHPTIQGYVENLSATLSLGK
jgi:acyl transferase domain-containing protein